MMTKNLKDLVAISACATVLAFSWLSSYVKAAEPRMSVPVSNGASFDGGVPFPFPFPFPPPPPPPPSGRGFN
jgi:hypothetical protein